MDIDHDGRLERAADRHNDGPEGYERACKMVDDDLIEYVFGRPGDTDDLLDWLLDQPEWEGLLNRYLATPEGKARYEAEVASILDAMKEGPDND